MIQPPSVTLRGSTKQSDYGFTTNDATFSVFATAAPPLRYQWRFNGIQIPAATNNSWTVPNVGLAQDGLYDVLVTDYLGSITSAPARLKVLVSPTFLQPPLNQWVPSNSSFTASAVIRGNPPPFRYEWRNLSTPLRTNVTESTTNFFTTNFLTYGPITNVNPYFRVIVFNEASPLGVPAQFAVTELADQDGDGLADDWETQFGLAPTDPTDAELDSDGDTVSNRAEYLAGTDPTDRGSFLKLSQLRLETEPPVAAFLFGAVSNHTYTIEAADSPTGLWRRLTDIPAAPTNRVVECVDPQPAEPGRRFYRVATPRTP